MMAAGKRIIPTSYLEIMKDLFASVVLSCLAAELNYDRLKDMRYPAHQKRRRLPSENPALLFWIHLRESFASPTTETFLLGHVVWSATDCK